MTTRRNDAVDVSVVISTYNRGERLRHTLESLQAQACGPASFDAIIVDNNSTDDTRKVVEAFVARSDGRLRYLFEPRPGVAFGRNAGIRATRGPILAFTDDDVVISPDWIANIKRAFHHNPDVDYVTGKILPAFEAPPPAWLTRANRGPCTIPDRGDRPIYSTAGRFFPGWATANLAIRRPLLDRIGLFAEDFLRGEDLELIIRVWRAHGRGMYAPDVVVTHKVPKERTTKAYHRMWHTREGEIRSRVRYKEIFDREGRIVEAPPRAQLFGAPAFLIRELIGFTTGWLLAATRRDDALAFFHETQIRQNLSYLRRRFQDRRAPAAAKRAPADSQAA